MIKYFLDQKTTQKPWIHPQDHIDWVQWSVLVIPAQENQESRVTLRYIHRVHDEPELHEAPPQKQENTPKNQTNKKMEAK